MKKLLLLVVAAVVVVDAGGQALEPKRTVIAGVVENFEGVTNVAVVNYCDPFDDLVARYTQRLDRSGGAFCTDHDYVFAQNITLRAGDRWVNLFITPGDSVFVRIDARTGNAEISGDGAERSREIDDWMKHVGGKGARFDTDVPSEKFVAQIEADFAEARKRIDAYADSTGMSDFVRGWAWVDHKFMAANYMMDYRAADAWDIFTGPLFDLWDGSNFLTMYFSYHLQVCAEAFLRDNPELSRLGEAGEYITAIRIFIAELNAKAPKGVVRDMILYRFLREAFADMPELYAQMPELGTAFSYRYFAEKLDGMVSATLQPLAEAAAGQPLSGISYLADGGVEALPEVKLMEYLREKYAGKVLYIDFWATWCGPCLSQMEHAPALHDYFKGRDDVVFINLCASSNPATWLPTIERNGVHGENYFLDADASTLFMGEYNLAGYPSYMIVDKQGNLHPNAPQPSMVVVAVKKIEECL
jgi:thiol-disulfide isomerase/thioredoxin